MTKPFARCNQERIDCFAYRNSGKCAILRSTIFNKVCPFYKTKEQFEADLIKYPYIQPALVDRKEGEEDDI